MSVIVGKSGFANQTTFEALMDKANHPKTNWDLSSYKNQPDIYSNTCMLLVRTLLEMTGR